MNVVACRDVTLRFGDLLAVDGVSLSVRENEVFGIIGPNGAGKTTLLNCLEGLDTPTSGSIEVLGLHPVKDAQQLAQRTGIQLQHAALLPRIKVGEALELFSSFYTQPVPWRPSWRHSGSRLRRNPTSLNCPVASGSAFSSPSHSFTTRNCSFSTS